MAMLLKCFTSNACNGRSKVFAARIRDQTSSRLHRCETLTLRTWKIHLKNIYNLLCNLSNTMNSNACTDEMSNIAQFCCCCRNGAPNAHEDASNTVGKAVCNAAVRVHESIQVWCWADNSMEILFFECANLSLKPRATLYSVHCAGCRIYAAHSLSPPAISPIRIDWTLQPRPERAANTITNQKLYTLNSKLIPICVLVWVFIYSSSGEYVLSA